MEEQMNKFGIILDGKMDEPIWDTVPTYEGCNHLQSNGGKPKEERTYIKFLPCEDRIYVGVKCMEPGNMAWVEESKHFWNSWGTHDIEVFLAPSGDPYEFYQFVITYAGDMKAYYYTENGNVKPEPYAPVWKRAVYSGDEYWSLEAEIPLTAFYWTPAAKWTDTWLVNIARTRTVSQRGAEYSTWAPVNFGFIEPENFNTVSGFPVRPAADEIRIVSAAVSLKTKTDSGYTGIMTVKATVPEAGEFAFASDHGDSVKVSLNVGDNEFTVPCRFTELCRTDISLALTRLSDGKEFKRYYPVRVTYEPLQLQMTLPEYRNNFYPGQDYTKIVGKAIADVPVTLTLEGAGIPKQTVLADADGSFRFDTPNFEIGEAWLTATIDGVEVKKRIRRLAPIENTMAWVSGGNLVIDGEPTVARKFYGPHYRGGVSFNTKYDADIEGMHITSKVKRSTAVQPNDMIKTSEQSGGEATLDQMPSEEMLRILDQRIESMKGKDFVFYYLSDEPECRGVSPVYLKHMYEYICDKDPYHVVMIAIRGIAPYIDCADWFQTHPYICPYDAPDGRRTYVRPISSMGGYIDDGVNLNRPDKCIGFLPTCYCHPGARRHGVGFDYPTLDETIAHTWAAMIHGGKTLWPYAYHDVNDTPRMYEGFRYIFASFEALESLVLHGKRTTLLRSAEAEAVLYDKGDEQMFVLVNFTQDEQTVTLEGLTGTWHNFCHEGMLTGNTFTLKPLETLIGTSQVKDAGYPSYAETAALIDKLEYERTHRDNLLFECTAEIDVQISKRNRFYDKMKLFDGMRDNLAVELSGDERFIEMNLTVEKPNFSKVSVYGYNVDDVKLLVKYGADWSEPAIAEKTIEEFATILTLTEKIAPDAMRLEFGKELVELYEIEAI